MIVQKKLSGKLTSSPRVELYAPSHRIGSIPMPATNFSSIQCRTNVYVREHFSLAAVVGTRARAPGVDLIVDDYGRYWARQADA